MATMKYEIVIRDQTEESEGTPVSVDSAAGASATDNKAPKEKDQKEQGALASALVAVGNIKPYVQQVIGFGASTIEMRSGSAEMQRKANLLSSVGSSAITIIAAGKAGGLKAAASTTATLAIQGALQYAMNQESNRLQAIMEAENLSLRRSRLGMSTNHSRFGGTI